ncbi:hypothetical protein WICPIJ_004503 [Wickerhamomyces pijperi]|uniref:Uncharacterized protein n=1 Tax=Wickerhamomyces pijperi TaxID=599730 RepID=A0A9P8Q5V2_WICPI|nr:hypothetical protein WICPIJ_004503 [Wickerhamomyces pijperi]
MVTFAVITDQETRSKFQKKADKEMQHSKNVICNRTPFQEFYSKADVEYSNQHKHSQASVGEEMTQSIIDEVKCFKTLRNFFKITELQPFVENTVTYIPIGHPIASPHATLIPISKDSDSTEFRCEPSVVD